jgi:uncharacterized protein (DUF2236 family)
MDPRCGRGHDVVMLTAARDAIVGSTTSLFSHGPTPLEHTLDHMGDPGLLGPDSVSWRVIGDSTAFVGGIRALLVQTCHPEVVAGVEQHSQYRSDPLGRLTRTAVYVTETTYGSMPEVNAAVATVRGAHRPVKGQSERGLAYRASDPALAAWVHNVLTDSFLGAYQAFGPAPLRRDDADRFVEEQSRIGALLGADPMPLTAADLSMWITTHPALAATEAQRSAIGFLRRPPLSVPVLAGYRPLFNAAVATIPYHLRRLIDVPLAPGSHSVGRVAVNGLRWALGSSPAWHVALVRSGAPVPEGLFRQPLRAG